MAKFGSERPLLVESFAAPTTLIDLGTAIGSDGQKIATAGVAVPGIADDDFAQLDLDFNTENPVNPKSVPCVTLGLCRVLLGGTVTAGQVGAVDVNAKFQAATAGQVPAVVFREGGAAGDLVSAFKLPLMPKVASTTIAALTAASGTADGTVDDVGATFNQATLNNNFQEMATKINAIRTALREQGVIL